MDKKEEGDSWLDEAKEKMRRESEERERGKNFECLSCGAILKVPLSVEPNKCSCGAKNWKLLFIEYYTKSEYEEALKNFREKNLLDRISKEQDKNHIEDYNLRMTNLLVMISGLLKNQKQRMSQGILGDTSVGKNNLIETNLFFMPKDSYMYVSNATQSVLEDDIKDKRIIAFKEINFSRERGANKELLEVIKQLSEGGTSSLKKDSRTNFKEVRHEIGEQKTIIYPTTESEKDKEGETRFIYGTIKSEWNKIKKVNENTFNSFSDLKRITEKSEEKDSWIRIGLTCFFNSPEQYEFYLPYADFFKEQIDGQYIFDNSDARSQRDIKRLLNLTCAMTYLFQEQRKKEVVNGVNILISEPEDFINTLRYSNEFFNQTYSGVDVRIHDAYKFIETKGKNVWVDKVDIQEALGIKHRDTINKYLWDLESKGFLERLSGKNIIESNERSGSVQILNACYKRNHIYYKSVQKAFSKRLISVQLEKLKEFLERKCSERSVQLNKKDIEIIENNTKEDKEGVSGGVSVGENERLGLNTSEEINIEEVFNG
jgi:hypothetical protein